MRLNPKEFAKASAKVVDKELRAGSWRVYEEYEILTGNGGRYVKGLPGVVDLQGRVDLRYWEYQPLVRHQDLFLEFARLADDSGLDNDLDTEHNAKVALEWAETYGVLGLTLRKKGRHAWWSDPRGGEGDTVAAFVVEAWDANRTLRLYESAISPEGVDIEAIVPFIPSEHSDVFAATPDSAQEWALKQAINSALDRVQAYCHPHPYQRMGGGRQTGISYVEGYSFTNLLGAIWLQMLWLVYTREPGRCLNPECRRIISIEAPKQVDQGIKKNARGKYRTRKDKRFCSRNCINRHYYLTKVEPRRRAERVQRISN